MNYLQEIKGFYDRLETEPLSASAIALWHALIHTANRAGWPAAFTVALSTLSEKAGVSSRTVQRAREELARQGYITWQSRDRLAARYELISQYKWGQSGRDPRQDDGHIPGQDNGKFDANLKTKRNKTDYRENNAGKRRFLSAETAGSSIDHERLDAFIDSQFCDGV